MLLPALCQACSNLWRKNQNGTCGRLEFPRPAPDVKGTFDDAEDFGFVGVGMRCRAFPGRHQRLPDTTGAAGLRSGRVNDDPPTEGRASQRLIVRVRKDRLDHRAGLHRMLR